MLKLWNVASCNYSLNTVNSLVASHAKKLSSDKGSDKVPLRKLGERVKIFRFVKWGNFFSFKIFLRKYKNTKCSNLTAGVISNLITFIDLRIEYWVITDFFLMTTFGGWRISEINLKINFDSIFWKILLNLSNNGKRYLFPYFLSTNVSFGN